MEILDWLLDSDPAIRWQVMRDLTGAPAAETHAEHTKVAHQGLASHILASQKADGSWKKPDTPAWLSTLYTLLLLRSTGVDPRDPAVASAIARAESGLRWSDQPYWDLRGPGSGGNPFFLGEEEPCINGGVLALGAFFRHPNEDLARRLVGEQLPDGGWNCEAPKSSRSSFHTTICVLEGLLEYESAAGPAAWVAAARHRGEKYLLERSLFRRLSTRELANAAFMELAFPPRYNYDILRALDYFRYSGAEPDPRMAEAIAYLKNKRQPDGRWLLDRAYIQAIAVPFQEVPNEPSRWNTLRALRVLRWYEQA